MGVEEKRERGKRGEKQRQKQREIGRYIHTERKRECYGGRESESVRGR